MKRIFSLVFVFLLLASLSVSGFAVDDLQVRSVDTYSSGSLLSDLLTSIFGTYTPRTETVTVFLPDGSTTTSTEIVRGVAGLDYEWIASVSLFTLVLYCALRIVGGIFRWN